MHVIKPGLWQQGYTTEVVCTGHGWGDNGCGAVLSVEVTDLFYIALLDQDGSDNGDRLALFACPQCSAQTTVDGVPANVLYRLPNQKDWRPYDPNDDDPDDYERRHY